MSNLFSSLQAFEEVTARNNKVIQFLIKIDTSEFKFMKVEQ